MIVNAKPISGNVQGRKNKRHKVEDEGVIESYIGGSRYSSSLGRKRSNLLAYDTVEFMLDQQENSNHKNSDNNKRAVAGYNKTISRNKVIGYDSVRNLDQKS
jgi:hypothetical protein